MSALGHLIDEAQQQRATLSRIERLLLSQAEHQKEDLAQVNRRVSALERKITRFPGGAPSPAE